MSLGLDGSLYDYYDGEKHLSERKIIFVGNPHLRITEDYLRILRYFRFYGRIVPEEGKHDADTLEAIRELAHGLENISVERVWMEVSKILVGNHAPYLTELMYELGVAKHISTYVRCTVCINTMGTPNSGLIKRGNPSAGEQCKTNTFTSKCSYSIS